MKKTAAVIFTMVFLNLASVSAGWCQPQRHRWFGLPYLMTHAEFWIEPEWQYQEIRLAVYSDDGDLLAEGWQDAVVIGPNTLNFACQVDARPGRVEITIPMAGVTLSRCRYPAGVTAGRY